MLQRKLAKLPNKLWQLAEMALRDLERAEKSKKFTIDMSEWYVTNGKCSVCMAGAVLAFSVAPKCYKDHFQDYRNRNILRPEWVDDVDLAEKLHAINHLRCGEIQEALRRLPGCQEAILPPAMGYFYMPEYGEEDFKANFKRLISYLKKAKI